MQTETPNVIEGCMIFQWKEKIIPYMAYIEIAPHNQGTAKKYDNVAGCLIAFACRLSLVSKNENYQGYLTFDVLEDDYKNERKLMKMYADKYGAVRIGSSTTMLIPPEIGDGLITKYLQ